MAKFANILETVGRTPVVKINKLAPAGINLYVKIEAFNPLGSVKDRLALGIIEAAHAEFEARGYEGTRIEDIAARAGVAVPTVYKTFTNKRNLLTAGGDVYYLSERKPLTIEKKHKFAR